MLVAVVVLGPVVEGKNTQPIFRVVKCTQTGLDEFYKAVPNMREVAGMRQAGGARGGS